MSKFKVIGDPAPTGKDSDILHWLSGSAKQRPVEFKIYPDISHNDYIQVYIFHSRHDFLRCAIRRSQRDTDYSAQYVPIRSNQETEFLLGAILIPEERCNDGVVAHELLHAARDCWHVTKPSAGNPLCERNEEDFILFYEGILTAFWEKYVDKFTQRRRCFGWFKK